MMRDREEIAVYIARDNPQAAHKWIANLRKTAERAAEMALVDERTASLEIGLKL
ncbi:MAG: type II toxin-antitoxin system RelE/ParE family toxin [Acidobacteria bacterium]|nr:MAG: type II toxin-antitoxin system RelE/ParE family toxin [Acidobacteriota bacterium]